MHTPRGLVAREKNNEEYDPQRYLKFTQLKEVDTMK